MKRYYLIVVICFLFVALTAHKALSEDKLDKASQLSKLEGFSQQADKLLQEAIMSEPTNAKVHFRAGEVYFNMNWEMQGDQAFRNAFKLDSSYGPRIGERYYALGQIKLSRSDFANARRYFTMAADLNPSLKKNIAKHCIDAGEQLLLYRNDINTSNAFFSLATQYDPGLNRELNKIQLKKRMNDIQNESIRIAVNPNRLRPWSVGWDVWEPLNKAKKSVNAVFEEFGSGKSFFNYDIIIWDVNHPEDSDSFLSSLDSLIKSGKFIVLCVEDLYYSGGKKDEKGNLIRGPDKRYIDAVYVSEVANRILKKYGMEVKQEGKPDFFETTMLKTHPITNNIDKISISMMAPTFINILEDKNVKVIGKWNDKILLVLYEDNVSGGSLLVHGTRNFLVGVVRSQPTNSQDSRIIALTENIVKFQRDVKIRKIRSEIANIK